MSIADSSEHAAADPQALSLFIQEFLCCVAYLIASFEGLSIMGEELTSPLPQSIPIGSQIIERHASIPLSFPAILRNPGLSDRYAYLHTSKPKSHSTPVVVKRNRRGENEGKRWIRRKENGPFNVIPQNDIARRNSTPALASSFSREPAHRRCYQERLCSPASSHSSDIPGTSTSISSSEHQGPHDTSTIP